MNVLLPPTVYILFGEIAYEGRDTLAVLGSKEEAEELKLWGEQHKNYGYDGLSIEDWKVSQRHSMIPFLPISEPPSFSYWPHRPYD